MGRRQKGDFKMLVPLLQPSQLKKCKLGEFDVEKLRLRHIHTYPLQTHFGTLYFNKSTEV